MITDAALAPRPRADIAHARFGNSVLLYEPATRRLHTLNTSAALVWRRLDGLTTLWDVAGSLTDVFAADRHVIEGDVAAVVERFDALGLLARESDDEPAIAAPPVDEHAMGLRSQLDARVWPTVSGVYQAVGLTFRVRSEDADVAAELDRVLRPLGRADVQDEHVYSVRHRMLDGVAQWRVYFDGTPLGTVAAADGAVALLLWHLNQATIEHTAGVLFFHAGAVQYGERVVLLPAAMDSGKSTLTTALVRRGLSYITDEAVGLDVAVGRVLPFPKSICLDSGSHHLFPELFPDVAPVFERAAQGRWHLDPSTINGATIGRGGRISLVVSPSFSPGATTRLERVTDVDALRLLLDNSFDFTALGARGFHALVALAQQASVFRLEYGDLDAACEVVLQLARESR